MFPGVGSQHVGMGKEFYHNFDIARETIAEASDVLSIDLARLCFDTTSKEELAGLVNSQAALLAVCVATYRVYWQEIGEYPDFALGHSLGEYSALCCAGVLRFPDALTIVKQRGMLLDETAASMAGLMAWVINLDNRVVERLCLDYSRQGAKVYVSAYDAPTQSSISGPKADIMELGERLVREGAIVYPLNVKGPFHSPYMEAAARQINDWLHCYEYGPAAFPVIANQNALPYPPDRESIISNLSQQLVSPLRWQPSLDYLLKQGVDTAVEMGPDKVLKMLVKNNTSAISTYSLENISDLNGLKESLTALTN